jgi:excisionase family DNA binding protein
VSEFDFVSVATAAKTTRVSEQTIRRLMAQGQLPAYRIGNSVRIRREDLAAIMKPWQRRARSPQGAA